MPELLRLHPLDVYQRLDEAEVASLLVLTSAACGSCRAMRRALEQLPEVGFPLRVIEVDAGASQGLVQEHGAFHLPALYLYTRGEFHGEVHAAPVPELVAAAIRAVAAGARGELD